MLNGRAAEGQETSLPYKPVVRRADPVRAAVLQLRMEAAVDRGDLPQGLPMLENSQVARRIDFHAREDGEDENAPAAGGAL